MVPGKFRVSEIFVPISKSHRRFNESRNLVFLCSFLRLGFSNFWPRGLGVSDFSLEKLKISMYMSI